MWLRIFIEMREEVEIGETGRWRGSIECGYLHRNARESRDRRNLEMAWEYTVWLSS